MKPTTNISALLLVLLICLSQPRVTHSLFGKYTVHIINQMGNNQILHSHCWSKNDDLGTHDLEVNAEVNWSFREALFGTKFKCNMWWSGGHQEFYVFNSKDDTITNCCGTGAGGDCFWRIKEDGIYLYNGAKHKLVQKQKWIK